jgi:hypothetical protein
MEKATKLANELREQYKAGNITFTNFSLKKKLVGIALRRPEIGDSVSLYISQKYSDIMYPCRRLDYHSIIFRFKTVDDYRKFIDGVQKP